MTASVRKVAIVTSRFPFGNAEPYLNTELGELVKHFERIAVMPVRRGSGSIALLPQGIEVLDWPLCDAHILRRAARTIALRGPLAARTLRDIVTSKDPGRLKNAAVMLKSIALADWVLEHGYDHLHAYWLSTPATVACIAAQIAGISWSATAHRWDIYERNAFDVKGRSAAFVRAISARGAADVWARMPQLEQRVRHVRLGAVVPRTLPDARAGGTRFCVICPAALVPIKGHADLLSAIAQLRAWHVPVQCTIAGQGPLREVLEERAETLDLRECVEFAGYIPASELHERYRTGAYHAVVLASRSDGATQMEGVPSALIEAMAEGVPVVATDSGSVCELLDTQSGWIVPPSNPDALARALLEVYLNPGTARVRARRAHEIVAERHDVRAQMRELAGMLRAQRIPV